MNFSIKSVINKTVAEECAKPLCKSRASLMIIAELCCLFACFFLERRKLITANPETRIVIVLIILLGNLIVAAVLFLEYKLLLKNTSKRMIQQIQTTHHTDSVERMVDFNDNEAVIHRMDDGEMNLYLKDLQKWFETSSFIMMSFTGQILLVFDKKDISDSIGIEEFKKYLTKFVPVNKTQR